MIFQEPMTSLNPVFRIEDQVAEVLLRHKRYFEKRGAPSGDRASWHGRHSLPEIRMRDYPHQMSGGMRQRAMIAMAIACKPRLIIADEPTTALDVTIQAQILSLLDGLRETYGMAILLITHDLGVIAGAADEVIVMYTGRVVEKAAVKEFFKNPLHPYTQGLMRSAPGRGDGRGQKKARSDCRGSSPACSRCRPGVNSTRGAPSLSTDVLWRNHGLRRLPEATRFDVGSIDSD